MKKHWTALAVRAPRSAEDEVLLALSEAGTSGLHLESGVEEDQTIVAWFPDCADLTALRGTLAAMPGTVILRQERLAEEPWVERQEAERRPLTVGTRWMILPAGDEPGSERRQDGRVVLVVPPKRAFGTGEHATTRLCLELLETIPVESRDVLDLGTGSGILALAAAALGAKRVLGIDDDPEAIEMAHENLGSNPMIARAITLVVGREACLHGSFPLILANIYANVLEGLAHRLSALQPARATAVLSGFSPEDATGVAKAWAPYGYREARRARAGEWCALVLERAR